MVLEGQESINVRYLLVALKINLQPSVFLIVHLI